MILSLMFLTAEFVGRAVVEVDPPTVTALGDFVAGPLRDVAVGVVTGWMARGLCDDLGWTRPWGRYGY